MPTSCVSCYPHFSLQDPSTTLYLAGPSSLPIRLSNCLSSGTTPLSTYNLISPTTEAYLTPSSMIWSTTGTHFWTGSDCLIALFDVMRNGDGPIVRKPTIPSKRHKIKGGGVGIRGIVSSLSLQPSTDVQNQGMLAAGTWTRWVGLYDMEGMGGMVTTWSVAESADKVATIGGTGVTQTVWSRCGRYLCVAERCSDGVLVYDVRVTGKLVAWLEGRNAKTNQRLSVDLFEDEKGIELWAGGEDGTVRVWKGVGQEEGAMKPSWQWAAHEDPIGSTAVHSSGSVVATCSGERIRPDLGFDEVDSNVNNSAIGDNFPNCLPDNTVKVWSL